MRHPSPGFPCRGNDTDKNMTTTEALQNLGLNEKEAKVYLASLELGYASVQSIAKKADINRATAYFIIEGLMKKGLMTQIEKDKKTFFAAEDPKSLRLIIERKEQEAGVIRSKKIEIASEKEKKKEQLMRKKLIVLWYKVREKEQREEREQKKQAQVKLETEIAEHEKFLNEFIAKIKKALIFSSLVF